jgi:hypothetical protein
MDMRKLLHPKSVLCISLFIGLCWSNNWDKIEILQDSLFIFMLIGIYWMMRA